MPSDPAVASKCSQEARLVRKEWQERLGVRSAAKARGVLAEALSQPCLRTCRVSRLFTWTWKMGPQEIDRLFEHAGIGPLVKVGDLNDDQRRDLVAELLRGPRPPRPARPDDYRGLYEELDHAVVRHRRMVRSESCPAEDFGLADSELWVTRTRLLTKQGEDA